jgi:hypothetical protein
MQLPKVGGYISTEFKLASDFDLWSRFYLYTELYGTTSPLGGFRCQLNQKSRQKKQYISEAEKSLEKMRTLYQWKPNISRNIISKLKLQEIPKVRNYFYQCAVMKEKK